MELTFVLEEFTDSTDISEKLVKAEGTYNFQEETVRAHKVLQST